MLKLRRALPALLATLVPFAFIPGCGVDDSTFDGDGLGASSSGGNGTSGGIQVDPDGGGTSGRPDGSSGNAVGCGTGFLDATEKCDDGNALSGDGCSADCQTIEAGFTCAKEGAACLATCGDGLLVGDEACDDGNAQGGDGCSDACQLTEGFQCLTPGSPCTVATCGNGLKEGLEQCDDNDQPYDGCFACKLEPVCNGSGCAGICGDGVIYPGEACDDGNTRSGDGCSADCTTIEQGFNCENRAEALPDELVLPVLYRDFKSPYASKPESPKQPLTEGLDLAGGGHPDFEHYLGNGTVPNLVKDRLGPDGRPEFNPATDPCNGTPGPLCQQLTGADEFYEWYHAGRPGDAGTPRSIPVTRTLTLGRIAGTDSYQFDSDKAPYKVFSFFPLDADNAGYGIPTGQRVCRDIDYANTSTPQLLIPKLCLGAKYNLARPGCANPTPTDYDCIDFDESEHNFGFTTELHFWFTYEVPASDAVAPKLSFSGDDDVWIFINGRRVVDLGGLHGILTGDFTLTAANAATLGMTAAGVYDIALFHAERRSRASNFKFTLGGFLKAKTFCEPVCGDGVKTKNETCDNGDQNLGGYGQCTSTCTWGPRCGDRIIQRDLGEACDDGNFEGADGCNPNCQIGNEGPH